MKKPIKNLILIIFLAFLAFPVLAANPLDNLSTAAPDAIEGRNINQFIGSIIQTLLGVVGVIFLILIIYGGVTLMTAGGDTTKVQKSKDIITKAVIGLVIIMASYVIAYTISESLIKSL
jgi:amino acid transporter